MSTWIGNDRQVVLLDEVAVATEIGPCTGPVGEDCDDCRTILTLKSGREVHLQGRYASLVRVYWGGK